MGYPQDDQFQSHNFVMEMVQGANLAILFEQQGGLESKISEKIYQEYLSPELKPEPEGLKRG